MAAHGTQLARRWADEHGGMSVEIEIDGLDQLEPVLKQKPNIVLLDNFSIPQLSEAVAIRNRVGSLTQLEASGGIRLETLRAVALTGVERISVGALVHQARSIDLAMEYQVS
jgi:nicotinate-nucleotide pyrophosphorylase (carboxylating)